MKKRILITGSNGLVGQALINELSSNSQYEIIATSLHHNRHAGSNYFFEILDITNISQVNYVFDLYKPDVVIHSAAISQIDFCEKNKDIAWSVNVDGTKNIAVASAKISAKIIYLSSDFVFDGVEGMYAENDAPKPVSFYGNTKLEAEKIIQNYAGKWAIVRTVLVYGMNYRINRANILTWVIDSLKEEKAIQVVNDQYRTPTLDSDLADGIFKIIEKSAEGIFHISGKEYLSVYEFALTIAEVFQFDASLISPVTSLSLNQTGRRPAKTGFDISKAIRELEYSPSGIKEGLEKLNK